VDSTEDCKKSCDDDEYFCSYCFDDSHCVELSGIKNKEKCEKAEACYLPR
jgi:hypothetical protein